MIVSEQTKISFFKELQKLPNPEQLLEHLTEKLPALSLEFEDRNKEKDIHNLEVPGKD